MVWETALALFFMALTILVVLAIPIIPKIKETLTRLNRTLSILNKDMPELMENINDITEAMSKSSKKIESTIDDIAELEQLVSKEIKQPLQNIAQSISMLLQLGNKIFSKKEKKRK